MVAKKSSKIGNGVRSAPCAEHLDSDRLLEIEIPDKSPIKSAMPRDPAPVLAVATRGGAGRLINLERRARFNRCS